ncbi:MAG: aminomethyl-transferring glycine dehydrogenase subunit GcvPA [Firmicutes bacterium]|nr:aminomethyl-transferring glycine dehydrogenase subunit GcvPA [Bacillota bacterium]
MLRAIGVESTDALFADIPPAVRLSRPLDLPGPLSEQEIDAEMRALAQKNLSTQDYACFLGAGAYDHYIPAVVDAIIRRGEFLTAYTPYQPEISQGVLQAIYEYQTMVCELLGLEVANASMYDGASALAEAAVMALHATGRKGLAVARSVHPDYRRVIRTYTEGLGAAVTELPMGDGATDLARAEALITGETAAVIVQMPNFFGCLEPVRDLARLARQQGALFIVAADPISLGILEAPGHYGADIAVAEGQSLGNPLSFGGPWLGMMATTEKLLRRLPGRIAGATVDVRGQRGFVLTLQAREQHIRREKATSNICTNQALNALAATVYLTWLGKQGIRELAEHVLQKAHYAQRQIASLPGWRPAFSAPFFKEFAVLGPAEPARVQRHLLEKKILGGYSPSRDYPEYPNLMLFAVTEKRTREEIDRLAAALGEVQ